MTVLGTPQERAVAAYAASLALAALDREPASRLAEAEGLVTHLTSLVLVGEAGETQEGVPAMRKVALPTPHATRSRMEPANLLDFAVAEGRDAGFSSPAPQFCVSPHAFRLPSESAKRLGKPVRNDLSTVGPQIDWDAAPNRLLAGNLSGVDPAALGLFEQAAALPEAAALAKKLNVEPIVLIIALVARALAPNNRSAARIAKAILGARPPVESEILAERLGLDVARGRVHRILRRLRGKR